MVATIDQAAVGRLSAVIGQWDEGTTCLAALALALDAGTGGPLHEAARAVVSAAGLGDVLTSPPRLPFSPVQLHGMVASPLLQGATLVTGAHPTWADGGVPVLAAQGHASGSAALLFATFILPRVPGLAARLGRPGAQMLDVGTGIGALAVGFARTFPHLHVTGIDVMARVLELARAHVATAPEAARIELRHQDVAELSEQGRYDLAWVPAAFVPQPALDRGLTCVVAALRPGGLLMLGHGRLDGSELQNAVTRFKAAAYGGTALDGPTAASLLTDLGLKAVHTVPTPPGAPAITIGST